LATINPARKRGGIHQIKLTGKIKKNLDYKVSPRRGGAISALTQFFIK
jgi:hypothetical protein